MCFPIHVVIKRDFSQALMDKDKTIVCLRREFRNTEHIIFGLASENTNDLQETETYFRLFWNLRKENHFRTVLSICFNSYFYNPAKYLYDKLKLISSRQKRQHVLDTLMNYLNKMHVFQNIQHVSYPTFLTLFLHF